jgi:integrase
VARAAPAHCPSGRFCVSSTADTRPAPVDRRRTSGPAQDRRRNGRQAALCAPHELRHVHAVELAEAGVPLIVTQRQLGQSNLGIISVYRWASTTPGSFDTVHARRRPMIPVSTSIPR